MKEKEENVLLEDPEMTEKEKTKFRLKYFFLIVGVLLVFIAISIILLIVLNKELPNNNSNKGTENNWEDSYEKAKEFISNLNLTERIGLLFGTENMKFRTPIVKNMSEKAYICVGQIDPLKNSKVDFKGMCLQDGPAGVRFAN